MTLYFLSSDNLRSNAFVKDFVFHFRPQGQAILLHAAFGRAEDTKFVSKRLSAYLSEEMVVNTVLNGDQRKLIEQQEGQVQVRADLIEAAFQQVRLIVMNPLSEGGPVDIEALILALRGTLPIEELVFFPGNAKSALGATRLQLENVEEVARLRAIYDEDSATLDLIAQLLPATLTNPAQLQVSV